MAIQIISNDKTVRNNTVRDLKDCHSQSLATPAKNGEQLFSMMPTIWKGFQFMGDDIVEISTKNECLKTKIGCYDKKWLEESKAKLLKDFDDEKTANLIMSTMEKQMRKQY